MTVHFCTAKNGSRTCTVNGTALHSLYDPQKEAERVFDAVKPEYIPHVIIVVSSGLPYYGRVIKNTYPSAILVSIQFLTEFSLCSDVWTAEWTPICKKSLESFIADYIDEETAPGLWLSIWPAGARIWQEETENCTAVISRVLKTVHSLHATRAYFGKKWLTNMMTNVLYMQHIVFPPQINVPVLVISAGPNLDQLLPVLSSIADYVYIIAVSSALKALNAYNIAPDMCITTDGGFYAGEHLHSYSRHAETSRVILAAASESFIPHRYLSTLNFLPLAYGTPLECALYKAAGIFLYPGKRNGTVSGTAAELALSLTNRNVYIAGLDLQNDGGKSHCRPHEAAVRQSSANTRLSPYTGAIFDYDPSLDMYAQWFDNRPLSFWNRIRVVGYTAHRFAASRTITADDFIRLLRNEDHKKFIQIQTAPAPETQRKKNIARVFTAIETDLCVLKNDYNPVIIAQKLDEQTITGDFVRYAAWQELSALKHANFDKPHTVALCDTALNGLYSIQQKINRACINQIENNHE